MHLRRTRALVGLLTLQAGLVAYSGARAARAFMEQSPQPGEARVFAPAIVALDAKNPSGISPATTPAVSGRSFVFDEIINPWQPTRSSNRPASEESADPWHEPRVATNDPELIDPWRNTRVASLDAPVAAFDWDTSPPELLNPWPTAVAPLNYDLNELVDPWSNAR